MNASDAFRPGIDRRASASFHDDEDDGGDTARHSRGFREPVSVNKQSSSTKPGNTRQSVVSTTQSVLVSVVVPFIYFTESSSTLNGNIVREITETWTVITLKMKWSILAVVFNGLLIVLLSKLRVGVQTSIDESIIQNYGGVIVELVLLICNIITIWSLEEAASCIFGYLLCQKSGFSLAACGFLQTPSFAKLPFSQTLSLTSPSRKILARISIIWIIAEFLKLITPFSAISLNSVLWSEYNDVSSCAYFAQDNTIGPVDRMWPTLNTEVGVGEYVFGSSLGIMRSEVSGVNVTTAQYPPSLISSLNNGDTIQGPGFTADISTTCECSTGLDVASLVAAGVDAAQGNATYNNFASLQGKTGITFGLVHDLESITISNVLSGFNTCGGVATVPFLPLVCSTRIYNHMNAVLEIQFMTDGTTASIAPNTVSLVELSGPADIGTWLSFAMNAILNGPTFGYELPPTVPGSLSTLLWWTSPNLIAVDRALVEAGIETMYAILFKGEYT
ncbi:hypothetical protein HDU82_007877 [Entophlyctis luteolus]|nr:hypothetical protein HDU82_007877 [Entophlyctis luteolus]